VQGVIFLWDYLVVDHINTSLPDLGSNVPFGLKKNNRLRDCVSLAPIAERVQNRELGQH